MEVSHGQFRSLGRGYAWGLDQLRSGRAGLRALPREALCGFRSQVSFVLVRLACQAAIANPLFISHTYGLDVVWSTYVSIVVNVNKATESSVTPGLKSLPKQERRNCMLRRFYPASAFPFRKLLRPLVSVDKHLERAQG